MIIMFLRNSFLVKQYITLKVMFEFLLNKEAVLEFWRMNLTDALL